MAAEAGHVELGGIRAALVDEGDRLRLEITPVAQGEIQCIGTQDPAAGGIDLEIGSDVPGARIDLPVFVQGSVISGETGRPVTEPTGIGAAEGIGGFKLCSLNICRARD